MPTFSRGLEQSLHRALALANERHHEYATLEHLLLAVCTENSNSNIMVMQSAKDRVGMDTSSSLNWARERRVLI